MYVQVIKIFEPRSASVFKLMCKDLIWLGSWRLTNKKFAKSFIPTSILPSLCVHSYSHSSSFSHLFLLPSSSQQFRDMAYRVLAKWPQPGACPHLLTCRAWSPRTKETTPTWLSCPKTEQDGQTHRNKPIKRGRWESPGWTLGKVVWITDECIYTQLLEDWKSVDTAILPFQSATDVNWRNQFSEHWSISAIDSIKFQGEIEVGKQRPNDLYSQ